MRAIKVDNPEPAAEYLADTVGTHLEAGERVFLLLSGGSCVDVAVAAAKKLDGSRLDLLNVTLADERYGNPGHKDSNWQKLIAAGLTFPGATLEPVLTGKDLETTVLGYGAMLETTFATAAYSIGLFGIGADGHTAGILPGSPAEKSDSLACGYEWDDFVRITMAKPAIAKLDEAVAYAVGSDKHGVLAAMFNDSAPNQPVARVLIEVPTFSLFNDYQGDSE